MTKTERDELRRDAEHGRWDRISPGDIIRVLDALDVAEAAAQTVDAAASTYLDALTTLTAAAQTFSDAVYANALTDIWQRGCALDAALEAARALAARPPEKQ